VTRVRRSVCLLPPASPRLSLLRAAPEEEENRVQIEPSSPPRRGTGRCGFRLPDPFFPVRRGGRCDAVAAFDLMPAWFGVDEAGGFRVRSWMCVVQ
jgi:hypothetical protein